MIKRFLLASLLVLTAFVTPSAQSWTLRHQDHFTDTPFTELISHTPDTGTGWANPAGAGFRPTIDTAGTGLRNGGDNRGYITTSLAADQAAELTLKNTASLSDAHLYVRFTSTGTGYFSATGYGARVNQSAGSQLGLYRFDNGSATDIGGGVISNTWADGDVLRIEAVSTGLTVKVNGVTKLTGTDGTYATGTAALFNDVGGDPCGDDFAAYDSTGGGGGGGTARGLLLLGVGGLILVWPRRRS